MEINEDVLYFLDFETGGLKSYVNGVCSVFISKYNSIYSKNFIFYPQNSVYNIEALNINGFTMDDLYSKGSSRNELIKTIANISEATGLKQNYLIFCAWNSEFDISFLNQIYKEKGKKFPCPIIEFDLMAVAKKNIKKRDLRKKEDSGVENYKLVTIYSKYFDDLDETKTHNAEYDVMMLEKLYHKFKELKYI